MGILWISIEELDLFDHGFIFTLPHRALHEHSSRICQPIGPRVTASVPALMGEHSFVRSGIGGRAEQGANGIQGVEKGDLPPLRAQFP